MAKRRPALDPIDVLEAAYDLERDDRAWLHHLTTCVRPFFDGGHGIAAYIFDVRRPIRELYADAVLVDMGRKDLPQPARWAQSYPEFARAMHTKHPGLLSLSEVCGRAGIVDMKRELPDVAAYLKRTKIVDFTGLQTIEPGGRGIVFVAGQRECRTYDARTRRMWARINAHMAAGRRLREAIPRGSATAEVILRPSGKVEHAEGEGMSASARAILRDAVLRVEKARGKQRRTDPDAATEAWTALVSGRWSLVDRFEEGGRRYVVARRNEHGLPDPRALTPRERVIAHLAALGQSNKLIAYELGLSLSTVASHLTQVMRKLRVTSRVQLIGVVKGLEAGT